MNVPRPLGCPPTTGLGGGAWLVIGWLITGYPASSHALSVEPTVVELRAATGAQASGVFHVFNDAEEPATILVEPQPISTASYGKRPPQDWLTLSPSTLTLAPKQKGAVSYRVRVPSDTSGELAAEVVFVQNLSGTAASGVQVRFGMALYVSVTGTERLQLLVEPLRLQGAHPPSVLVPITNQGNVHCRPEGSVVVTGDKGAAIAHGTLSRGMPAPPGQTAHFTVPLSEADLPPGTYQLQLDLRCRATADLPARWTVEQTGRLDETGQWIPAHDAAAIHDS